MIGHETPQFISIPNTVSLIREYGTIDNIETALDIIEQWYRTAGMNANIKPFLRDFELMSAFGAIFEAGRIQGMREVRARKRNNA